MSKRLFLHQRGDESIPRAHLPYKYEAENTGSGLTALAGVPLYLDLSRVLGVTDSIRRHVRLTEGKQGWTDEQVVLPLILLNLAGGEHVSDLEVLERDEGFCRVLRRVELAGLPRRERRAIERRRAVPSVSAVFRPGTCGDAARGLERRRAVPSVGSGDAGKDRGGDRSRGEGKDRGGDRSRGEVVARAGLGPGR